MGRRAVAVVLAAVTAVGSVPGGPARGDEEDRGGVALATASPRWEWPVEAATVSRPYRAPATRYAAGHRGIDLAATAGARIAAPTDGVVLFAGRVVDRGVLTLDVGGGVVVTLEPVATALSPGDVVVRGVTLGTVDVGGHATPGDLHLGVREDGEYVDPMRFYGGTPRAVLLPCC